MAVINFPDSPLTGERFTVDKITYEWKSEGYWKSIEASVGSFFPSVFALYLNSTPADSSEVVYQLDMAVGQTLDIEDEFSFGLIGNNPVSNQVYDIYLNEVLATDQITVDTSGNVSFAFGRAPFTGPITIKVRVATTTAIDSAFDGFGLSSEVYTV